MFIKEDSTKMAELLRSGYTMLNLSCPICNNPVFKSKNEDLFCAICNREVLIVESNSIENTAKKTLKKPEQKREINNLKNNLSTNFNNLNNAIISKINWLTKLIKNEIQLELLEKQVKLMRELLDLYKIVTKF